MAAVLDDPSAPAAALGMRRWWALGAVSLAMLAVGVDGTVLSVALPTLSSALHASESDLQWFSSGYFLVLASAMLPAGLLGIATAARRSCSRPWHCSRSGRWRARTRRRWRSS